ncbi:glycosyltransferase [Spirochaeta cellobiosiphila]|uniref:glycosyltransferase n=1 Tax=Spirochaeta cellobiosiphila TaxID=504483 RepID=UPI00040B15FD|nr:glycosyltransferase [Spirochaeta cellobiosiphila]
MPDRLTEITKKERKKTLLIEAAWEVCNQVGGIYTVIRSKVPAMQELWGKNYCVLGPYVHEKVTAEFEEIHDDKSPFAIAVNKLNSRGLKAHYGRWLIPGRPQVVLLDPESIRVNRAKLRQDIYETQGILVEPENELHNQVIAFGTMIREFFREILDFQLGRKNLIGHFHEWMSASSIGDMTGPWWTFRKVFTTHATLLGRYLAMNDGAFYEHLDSYDWQTNARHFGILCPVSIERSAAKNCDVFTTVSGVTAKECTALLGRTPDVILPNGLNIQRFTAFHEFQLKHLDNKEKINEFVMGHFFRSYSFDLEKTLYFFTSGRFEYRNKGFDITLEALYRLNEIIKQESLDVTVVCFFITKQPFTSINPQVLQSRAVMNEIRETCDDIVKGVGQRIFQAAASEDKFGLPNLNSLVDDYLSLRLRRTVSAWKSEELPTVITHNLIDDGPDPILNFIRKKQFYNKKEDPVKVVYHPDFITPMNPLFKMEYGQFVRGCHLGIFPSYYEPWGYTPLECIASGIPTVTSDYSGFGEYVQTHIKDPERKGIFVIPRSEMTEQEIIKNLTDVLYEMVVKNRRERINLRNSTETHSVRFDWGQLVAHYNQAYKLALNSSPLL